MPGGRNRSPLTNPAGRRSRRDTTLLRDNRFIDARGDMISNFTRHIRRSTSHVAAVSTLIEQRPHVLRTQREEACHGIPFREGTEYRLAVLHTVLIL